MQFLGLASRRLLGGPRVSVSVPGPSVPDSFTDADWSVATGSAPASLEITVLSLPGDNGAPITGVEYDVDGAGSWSALGGLTGVFPVTLGAANTPYAIRLRAVNAVGPGMAGNSESAVSGAATGAVAPTITDAAFTAGAAGTPPSLTLVGDYAGADMLTAHLATVTGPDTPSAAQIIAGSGGGVLETASFAVAGAGAEAALSSLSPVSEAADEIHVVLAEDTGGGVSAVFVVTGVVIDATGPQIVTMSPVDDSTDFNGTGPIQITFSEDVFAGAGDVSIRNRSTGALIETISIGSAVLAGDTVTISHGALAAGDYYIEMPQGAVTDASGNPATALSGTEAWNFVVLGALADSFTAPAGTALTDYTTGESGRLWERTRDGTAPMITADGRLRGASDADVAFRYAIAETADHFGRCVMRFGAAPSGPASVYARQQAYPNGRNGYLARYNIGAGQWELRQRTGNGGVVLTSYADPGFASEGQVRTIEVAAQGTTIRLLIDGIERGSATDATHAQGCAGVLLTTDEEDGIQIEIDDFEQGATS